MIITYRQYDNYLKKIEAENLDNFGKSLAWTSMGDQAGVINCVRQDEETLEVRDDWKAIIAEKFTWKEENDQDLA